MITGTVQARYTQLETHRDPYLRRARRCSELTIPTLIPREGASGSTDFPTPYQSMGARGTNNLAAKMLLTYFPPNTPFFRFTISEILLEKFAGREGMRADIEEAFGRMERAVMGDIEASAFRAPLFETLKHLIVGGNYLIFLPDEGGVKGFRLDRYVVKRDPAGNLMELVTKESISPMEVPEVIRDEVLALAKAEKGGKDPGDSIDLYTHVVRTPTKWEVKQEVAGVIIPESRGSYPLDKSPWLALRLIAEDGADYGRGYVEEYIGDLQSLEGLSAAVVQAAAAASKVLFLVRPNATTNKDDLAKAPNGAVRSGNAEDVTVVQMEKYADFKIAYDMATKLEERLAHAFLLNSSIQRNAERVTAEEIRYMAAELDSALGGIHSTQAQELQLPIVTRIIHRMERRGLLPVLPKGLVRPTIVTGVEALGRGNDLSRLKGLVEDIAPILPPELLAQEVNVSDLIKRLAAARGIDAKGLTPTAQERAQRAQQQQMQAMVEQLGPNAVTQAGQMMQQRMAAQAAPAQ